MNDIEQEESPDPGAARSEDDLIEKLGQLRIWAGELSYETIAKRVNKLRAAAGRAERTSHSTVHYLFQTGRSRWDDVLLFDVIEVLTGDARRVVPWRQRWRIIRGEAPEATFVKLEKLPRDLPEFTGRAEQLQQFNELLETGVAGVAIDGMPGVGKTTLAVHAAYLLRRKHRFDTVLFMNLRGVHAASAQVPAAPHAILDAFLRQLGVPDADIPAELKDRITLYRAKLSSQRALVVLDDAADAHQVLSLLPDSPTCFTVITSRHQLDELPNIRRLPLQVFSPEAALDLLRDASGTDRFEADRDTAAVIAEILGYHPLAVHMVAKRIAKDATWTFTDHLDRLLPGHELPRKHGDPAAIDRIRHDRTKLALDLRLEDRIQLAFDSSYQGLTVDARRLLRALALHPGGDIDGYAAAALTRRDLPPTQQDLDELVTQTMLQHKTAGRFELHELVRAFALARAIDEDRRPAHRDAVSRLLGHYLHAASVAMNLLAPHDWGRRPPVAVVDTPSPALTSVETARAWLDAERSNLVTAVRYAADHDWPDQAILLAQTIHRYLFNAGHYHEALATQHAALKASRDLNTTTGEATALCYLGAIYDEIGLFSTATDHLGRALTLCRQCAEPGLEAQTLNYLATVKIRRGQLDHATEDYEESVRLLAAVDEPAALGRALNNLGISYWIAGRYRDASERYQQALDACGNLGDAALEAQVRGNLGIACGLFQHYDEALRHFERTLEICQAIGDRAFEGATLDNLGIVYRKTGRPDQAVDHHQRALGMFQEIGNRSSEAEALSHLAMACHLAGSDSTTVIDYHEKALNIVAEIGASHIRASLLNDYGETLRCLGSSFQAVGQHENALTAALDNGDQYEAGRAYVGLACTLPNCKRAHLNSALQKFTDLGLPEADSIRVELADLDGE